MRPLWVLGMTKEAFDVTSVETLVTEQSYSVTFTALSSVTSTFCTLVHHRFIFEWLALRWTILSCKKFSFIGLYWPLLNWRRTSGVGRWTVILSMRRVPLTAPPDKKKFGFTGVYQKSAELAVGKWGMALHGDWAIRRASSMPHCRCMSLRTESKTTAVLAADFLPNWHSSSRWSWPQYVGCCNQPQCILLDAVCTSSPASVDSTSGFDFLVVTGTNATALRMH